MRASRDAEAAAANTRGTHRRAGSAATVRQSSADEVRQWRWRAKPGAAHALAAHRGDSPYVGRGSGRMDRMVFRLMHEY